MDMLKDLYTCPRCFLQEGVKREHCMNLCPFLEGEG
jgi:hypothetical protein